MRAAVLRQVGKPLSVETVDPLPPGPNDVIVELTASGICHSDLSIATGTLGDWAPMVLGHEGAGVVRAIGQDVTRVRVGDRVVGSIIPACGRCWWCVRDESHLCEMSNAVGAAGRVALHDHQVAPA